MPDMLCMVPTRGRRDNAARFAQAFHATVRGATDLLFITDDDDPSYAGLEFPAGTQVMTMPRATIVVKLNTAANHFKADYPVLMFTGDDTVPLTDGWDKLLCEAIAGMGGTGWAYPEDNRRSDIPEHWAVSSNLVDALGWFAHPKLNHFFIDNVIWEIANPTSGADCIRFVPEAVLDHLHPTTRPEVPGDETYAIAAGHLPGDQARFLEWAYSARRVADIATVKALVTAK